MEIRRGGNFLMKNWLGFHSGGKDNQHQGQELWTPTAAPLGCETKSCFGNEPPIRQYSYNIVKIVILDFKKMSLGSPEIRDVNMGSQAKKGVGNKLWWAT